MKLEAIVDAGGNVTAFLTGVSASEYSASAKCVMSDNPAVEQVAFLCEPKTGDVRIELMGGEFCCNAVRSIAYLQGVNSGREQGTVAVECSGVDKPVQCTFDTNKGTASAVITAPTRIESVLGLPLVRLEGIAHIIYPGGVNDELCAMLPQLCKDLGEQALGVMFAEGGDGITVVPVVYVRDTDTTVHEGSCGSGAVAVTAFMNHTVGNRKETLHFPKGDILTSVTDAGIKIEGNITVL